jgi:hypothetical protein
MNDLDWQEKHPVEARKIVDEHRDWIAEFASNIYTRRGDDANIQYIQEWVKKRAKEGSRVIIIDPITMINQEGDSTWVADKKIIMNIKATAEEYGCSIIFVTHPTKHTPVAKDGHVIPDIANVQGGTIICNASACVIWLRKEDQQTLRLKKPSDLGTTYAEDEIDKSLHVLKSRDGKPWTRIGMMFEDLNFVEKGVMV